MTYHVRLLQPRIMRPADLFTRGEWDNGERLFIEEMQLDQQRKEINPERSAEMMKWRELMAMYLLNSAQFLDVLNHNREIAFLRPVEARSSELDRIIMFDRWMKYYEGFNAANQGMLYVSVQSFEYPNKTSVGDMPSNRIGHEVKNIIDTQRKTAAIKLANHILHGDDKKPIGAGKQRNRELRREATGGTIPSALRMSWFYATLRTFHNQPEALAVAVLVYDPFFAMKVKQAQEMALKAQEASTDAMADVRAALQTTDHKVTPLQVPEPFYFDPFFKKRMPMSEYRDD